MKTQSLKGIVIDDDDYKQIFWAMKRVSERSGHDMAAGKAIPVPTLDGMKAEIDVIDQYRIAVQKRKKTATERREALERPVVGKTV